MFNFRPALGGRGSIPPASDIVNPGMTRWTLRRQLTICAGFCTLAVLVIVLFHRKPYLPTLLHGLPLAGQIAVGIGAAGLYWLVALLGSRFTRARSSSRHIAESYSRLDLRGWNPLWMAMAAGLGEELLFRGALQPLLGIWITSVLFVLAHTRAYRFDRLDKRVLLQSASLFVVSVAFGYIAIYAGLVTAMIVHAGMDVVGLCAVRQMTSSATVAPMK